MPIPASSVLDTPPAVVELLLRCGYDAQLLVVDGKASAFTRADMRSSELKEGQRRSPRDRGHFKPGTKAGLMLEVILKQDKAFTTRVFLPTGIHTRFASAMMPQFCEHKIVAFVGKKKTSWSNGARVNFYKRLREADK
jgi:hypothetical protein